VADRPIVLLVDDDDRVLSSLRRSLRREPFEIETVGNAERALERLRVAPAVALVISDFRMPGMTGLELLKIVRQRYRSTARILLSGWTSEVPSAELAVAELFATHEKPWDDAALKASIRSALGIG
jgi:DNA-binding NtrC family response regulator